MISRVISASLLITALSVAPAQMLPSRDSSLHRHPFIDRVDYFTPRAMARGAVAGLIAAGISRQHPYRADLIVGTGLGMIAGTIAARMSQLDAPPPRARVETMFSYRFRDWSRYVGVGGQIGASLGFLAAVVEGNQPHRIDVALIQLLTVAYGFMFGMIGGHVAYFLQH